MGGTMVRLASANQEFRVVGGTEQKTSPTLGKDIGTLAGIAPLGVVAEPDLDRVVADANAEVVIDFTQSKASTEHARICAARKVALVIGSTGFAADERSQVAGYAKRVPIVLAPNMSVGVNLMIRVAGELARVLGDSFDVEILEAHHRMKKDPPSAPALRSPEQTPASLRPAPST